MPDAKGYQSGSWRWVNKEETMIMNQSIKLARWWVDIVNVHDAIENSILPVGVHLRVDDQELMDAFEELTKKIRTHLEAYKLQAIPIDGQK
jgi:hypothetical protein